LTDNPPALNRHTSGALVAELRTRNSTMTDGDAKLAVARVFDALDAVIQRGEHVRIANFGTFRKKHREGRTARNPRTGETIQTSAKDVITFKQGKGA
jgi:integration host factor subunit beta